MKGHVDNPKQSKFKRRPSVLEDGSVSLLEGGMGWKSGVPSVVANKEGYRKTLTIKINKVTRERRSLRRVKEEETEGELYTQKGLAKRFEGHTNKAG